MAGLHWGISTLLLTWCAAPVRHVLGSDSSSLSEVLASALKELGGRGTAQEIRKCVPLTELSAFESRSQKGIAALLEKRADAMSLGLGKLGRACALLAKATSKSCGEHASDWAVGILGTVGQQFEAFSKDGRSIDHDDCYHFCDGSHDMKGCLNNCDVFEQMDSLQISGRSLSEPLKDFLGAWRAWKKQPGEAQALGRAFGLLLAPFAPKESNNKHEL